MNIYSLKKCLHSLLEEVETIYPLTGKGLIQQYVTITFENEITPYYVIFRNDSPPGTQFSETLSILLHTPNYPAPLAYEVHMVDGWIRELEMYNMDGSEIIYDYFWDSNFKVLPQIICQPFE